MGLLVEHNLISVNPAAFYVVHIIKKNKRINRGNQMKTPYIGKNIGLHGPQLRCHDSAPLLGAGYGLVLCPYTLPSFVLPLKQ